MASIEEKYEDETYRDLMKAFAAAAAVGDLPGLEAGLAAGADIDGLGEKWTGWTALHGAADAGQVEAVQLLLKRGANVNYCTLDYSDSSPLHLAVTKLHLGVVLALLAGGADTELWTATGCCGTALHLAAAIGDQAVCEALLAAGADAAAESGDACTVLHYLVQSQSAAAPALVQQVLVRPGAKEGLNAVDSLGCTALHRAAEVGDAGVVRVLLEAGADPAVKESIYGKTAEKVAEEMNQPGVLQLLVAARK
jgi:ankyrin repeat protein